jgi:DNA-binding NtrC family response regulator
METLLKDMGCEVRSTETIESTLQAAQQEAPDILIADLRLSGDENGLQAIKAIRELHPDLPALLITGDTAPHRLKLTKRTGVPLLHKPVGPDTLARAIQDELNAKSEYDITGTG